MAALPVTHPDVEHWFTYHAPSSTQAAVYDELRAAARVFAHRIADLVPDGIEKEQSVAALRGSVMWANAGIACAR